MRALALLRSLYAYQAWANDDLLKRIGDLDDQVHVEERDAAMRLLSHSHVVARIFSARLVGERHGYRADNTEEIPALAQLREAVAASDRWYLDYLEIVSPPRLAEPVAFTFTDGDKGCMTRQEMLAHVVLHGGYHRGEIGRILARLSIAAPWDTFAVHLHQVEPSRRLRDELPGAT